MVRAQKNLQAPLAPPAQSGDPLFWDVEPGIRLSHFSEGSGRNVLVVHGGPGIPFRVGMSGLKPLTAKYRFNYYDQRGSGDSTRPFDRFNSPNLGKNMAVLDRSLGLGAQIADIERIRIILGEEKLILVGHSWGGFLSALYAAEFPERVESLILISPATTLVLPQKGPDYYDIIRERLAEGQRAEYDALVKDYLDFNKIFKLSDDDLVSMNDAFGAYVLSTTDARLFKPGRSGGFMIWAMYASMGKRHDYRKALSSIIAPTLVLCGSKDLMTVDSIREYADLIPGSRFVVMEGASHFAYEEQPEKFAATLSDFLEKR
jgi:proline iminopeptidase